MNPAIIVIIRKRRIQKALANGAIIIDIRTPAQFEEGHTENAINIPADVILLNIERLMQLQVPLIICGPDSFRCFGTVRKLRGYGLDVTNGGSWWFVNRVKTSS